MKEFLTKNFLGILGFILLLIIIFHDNFKGFRDRWQGREPARIDTVSDRTVQVQQPQIIVVPMPGNQVSSTQPIIIPPQYQPNTDIKELTRQYEEILKKHLAVNRYKDSIELKDTAGNKVGIVNLNQTVSENELKEIAPDYTLNFPTRTITLQQPYKPRNQVFYGGGLTGNTSQPLDGALIGIQFKNKQDNIFGAHIGIRPADGLKGQFGVTYYRKF